MPLVNVEKDVLREGIKIRTNFLRTVIFIRESRNYKGGFWRLRRVVSPGTMTLSYLLHPELPLLK